MIKDILRSTWSIFLGIGFLMLGNGLQGTLTGWRAAFEGFSAVSTGWIMTGYYVGFLLGSFITPIFVRSVGHIRVFAALASLASTAVLIQILYISPWSWGVMRIITGFCFAGTYVIVESWLNARSNNVTRGRILSIYMLVTYVGMAGGQWLLTSADPAGVPLFLLSSILLSLALIPVLIAPTRAPEIEVHQSMSIRQLAALAPAGSLTIFIAAMAHGAMFGMSAVYAVKAGLTVAETSIFMSSFILLGALAQWPVGMLSDRFDRRKVILSCSILAALICFYLLSQPLLRGLWFYVLYSSIGALSLPIYSLGVSHTNDRLEPEQMVGASSAIIMLLGIGSVLGPITAGYLLDHVGLPGFFLQLTLAHLTIAGGVWSLMQRKPAVTEEQTTPFQNVPPRPTFVAMEAYAMEAEEAQAGENDESIEK